MGGAGSKKNAEIALEQDREVRGILERAGEAKRCDLEAWETGIRMAVLGAGAKALGSLLDAIGRGMREEVVWCRCGARMHSRGVKHKELVTILGAVQYRRSMYQCGRCGATRYPGDEQLDVVGRSYSPGLRRMMARAGSSGSFKEGMEDLKVYAGVEVSVKAVERVAESIGRDMQRWSQGEAQLAVEEFQSNSHAPGTRIERLYIATDGTGVPMTREEVAGRRGKQPDGSAKTREVKLGCVFTQTGVDEQGYPVRDPRSTSFVGRIESADEFGQRLFGEAVRRGLDEAGEVVVLGDGAPWITTMVQTHFPNATHIIDLYHAREHVAELSKVLFTTREAQIVEYRDRWWASLDEGEVEQILTEARRHLPRSADRRKKAQSEIGYLDKNRERMRYGQFRARGLFIGSGVVEAGCKSIIAQRLKQSGMRWSVRGANAIISLRCILKSGRLEDYWEARAA